MFAKKIQLTLLAILCYSFTIACTFPSQPFCRTFQLSPEVPTVVGKIVGVDDLGIDVEIIEILRGGSLNQTIRIWDGTDFDCNGPVSMAASDIGELNDTVIIILEKIIEQENTWDVIGEYRRPDPNGPTPELKLENGIVKGYVSGPEGAPFDLQIWSMEYHLFIERIIEDINCALIVSTEEIIEKNKITLNNPFSFNLNIRLEQNINSGSLKLYSLTGKIVLTKNINNQSEFSIQTTQLQNGIYFLEFWADGRRLDLIKVVKM